MKGVSKSPEAEIERRRKISETMKRKGIKPLSGHKVWNKGLKGVQKPYWKGKTRPEIAGKNNNRWRGGITSNNNFLRTSSMMKLWREAVFLRDKFICQNQNCQYCHNIPGGRLNAHHIKSFAFYPELRFDVNNGITYCVDFHLKNKSLHEIAKKEGIIIREKNKLKRNHNP